MFQKSLYIKVVRVAACLTQGYACPSLPPPSRGTKGACPPTQSIQVPPHGRFPVRTTHHSGIPQATSSRSFCRRSLCMNGRLARRGGSLPDRAPRPAANTGRSTDSFGLADTAAAPGTRRPKNVSGPRHDSATACRRIRLILGASARTRRLRRGRGAGRR